MQRMGHAITAACGIRKSVPNRSNNAAQCVFALLMFALFAVVGANAQSSTDEPLDSPYGSTLNPRGASQRFPGDQRSGYDGQQGSGYDSEQTFNGQQSNDSLNVQQLPEGVTLRNPQNSTNGPSYERYERRQNQQLPPDPLTAFQRLAAASTGKILPIFGASLFNNNVPSTFAPVDRVPVTPDYVIGPGDQLLIRLWGQVTLDSRFTVDRSGNIYIPQVGTVSVAGLPFSQLEQYLRSRISRNFRSFDINVNLGQLRSIQVFVVGEARRPGNYTISSLSTLVNALFASGGPAPVGSLRRIQVKRAGATVVTFDLYDLLLKGDKSKDVPLVSGDVIYIPAAGPKIAVTGSVDVPAIYEVKGESTIQDAIALAGGLSTMAENKKVRIERIDDHQSRSVLDVTLDQAGQKTLLHDGDIVVVDPIVNRFKDAVTLRGNVANPGRFVWFPGMRIRDLIPDKDALLTRDYWQRHNNLGLPLLDATPEIRQDAPLPVKPRDSRLTPLEPNALQTPQDSDSAIYARVNPNTSAGNDYTGLDAISGGSSKAGALALTERPAVNERGNGSISVGVTGTARPFAPKNTIVLSAPDIDWAYAVVQRLNKSDLTSKLLPFDLGKVVLDKDDTQNYELQPGDVVTIFSKADIRVPQVQQTKYVRLEGEFIRAGIYSAAAGETLRQLVARAGGFSANAYLYGSEFTRESTRVQQQQRMNDYANNLDHSANLLEANAANIAGTPADVVDLQSSVQNTRSLAGKLRQLQATGRIVLETRPDSRTVADLPDLPLEDGDRFVVPSVPSNVDVFGAVYNQNSFLYDPRRRAGDYLREAGGASRTADKRREFIVRADGSIVSRQYTSSFLSGGFDSTSMNPGDAIVLPEIVYHRPLIRQLVDISAIVGSFGIAAAVIPSLVR